MNPPKRWSSQGSEVDPVLRAVLTYARDQEPSSEQLQALLRGKLRARASTKPRRLAALVAAAAAVLGASAAWAGYRAGWIFRSAPPVPSAITAPASRSASQAAESARGARPQPLAPTEMLAPASSTPAPRLAPATSRPEPAADPRRDASLLQEARQAMAANPARALTLTRDHELHFPSSSLSEERAALQVEALARLGRSGEAQQALTAFDQRFPGSIYRRRLHSLSD